MADCLCTSVTPYYIRTQMFGFDMGRVIKSTQATSLETLPLALLRYRDPPLYRSLMHSTAGYVAIPQYILPGPVLEWAGWNCCFFFLWW